MTSEATCVRWKRGNEKKQRRKRRRGRFSSRLVETKRGCGDFICWFCSMMRFKKTLVSFSSKRDDPDRCSFGDEYKKVWAFLFQLAFSSPKIWFPLRTSPLKKRCLLWRPPVRASWRRATPVGSSMASSPDLQSCRRPWMPVRPRLGFEPSPGSRSVRSRPRISRRPSSKTIRPF